MRESHPHSQKYAHPIVFYDGGCSLCSREIAHYRRLDSNANLHWVDITRDTETLTLHSLDLETAMQRFHVLDVYGYWQTGAWGFAEMWAHLPYYRWLSKFLRFAGVLSPLDRLYSPFARWRAGKRCSDRCLPTQGARR